MWSLCQRKFSLTSLSLQLCVTKASKKSRKDLSPINPNSSAFQHLLDCNTCSCHSQNPSLFLRKYISTVHGRQTISPKYSVCCRVLQLSLNSQKQQQLLPPAPGIVHQPLHTGPNSCTQFLTFWSFYTQETQTLNLNGLQSAPLFQVAEICIYNIVNINQYIIDLG